MGDRNYSMHFIKFDGLKPATHYTYKVKSGAPGAQWSDEYTFRSMRPYPETRIAMYGDMGVSEYNNMANLLKDCQSGKIDLFAHMGDHCYGGRPHACFPAQPRPRFGWHGRGSLIRRLAVGSDLGMEDDRKGDAYMNAFQPVLATCPWVRLPRPPPQLFAVGRLLLPCFVPSHCSCSARSPSSATTRRPTATRPTAT